MIDAVPALEHPGQGRAGQPQHGADEDAQHPLLVLDVAGDEAAVDREAGVVDEQVDRPVAVGQPGLDGAAARVVGEVRRQRLDLHAVRRAQLGCQLLQALRVARDEDEVVAVGGEPADEGVADAGGRPGDECSRHPPTLSGGPEVDHARVVNQHRQR